MAILFSSCCPYGPQRQSDRISHAERDTRDGGTPQVYPEGRRCEARLRELGIRYRSYQGEGASGVVRPIILEGPIGGIEVRPRWGNEVHSVTDCRVLLALHRWAPSLRRAGVTEIQYFSRLRPNARVARTGRRSSHASALAIDVGWMRLEDGSELSILDDWEDRDRGEEPCGGRYREDRHSALMRRTVCEAAEAGIFQVLITPHHDHAHRNHLHLEVKPGQTQVWLR